MARYYDPRYRRRQQEEEDPEMIDSRSPAAMQAGLRNATFDFWGNLVRGNYVDDGVLANGQVVRRGDVWQRSKPGPTNLDRYKAGTHTPNLNAWHRANPDQMTSWGQPWDEAVKQAKQVDVDRRSMQQNSMGKFRQMSAARDKIRRQGIDTTNPRPNVGPEDFAMKDDPNWYSAWGRQRHSNKITSAPYSGSY